jgi:hypothetical protein
MEELARRKVVPGALLRVCRESRHETLRAYLPIVNLTIQHVDTGDEGGARSSRYYNYSAGCTYDVRGIQRETSALEGT